MAVVCILSKILCHRADPPISVSCRTTVQFHAQLKLERFYRHHPHPPILLSHNPQCSQFNHYEPIWLDNKKSYWRLPDKQITWWRGRYNGATDDWPILGSSAQLSWVARGDTHQLFAQLGCTKHSGRSQMIESYDLTTICSDWSTGPAPTDSWHMDISVLNQMFMSFSQQSNQLRHRAIKFLEWLQRWWTQFAKSSRWIQMNWTKYLFSTRS